MAASNLSGLSFEADGERITFFGVIGAKIKDDKWAVNGFGGSMLFPVDPDSMVPAIQECIKADVEAGNEDKLSMLLLAPMSAVVFYLEGQLTPQHFATVIEGPDYIDIPNVDFEGRTFTVRILRDAQCNVATADSEGNVIE